MTEKEKESRNSSRSSRPGAHSSSGRGDERKSRSEHRKTIRSLDAKRGNIHSKTSGESWPSSPSSSTSDPVRRKEESHNRRSHRSRLDHASSSHSTSTSAAERASRKEARHHSNSRSREHASNRRSAHSPPRAKRREEGHRSKAGRRRHRHGESNQRHSVEATTVDENAADERVRRLEEQMTAVMQSGAATNSKIAVASVIKEDESSVDERSFFQKHGCFIMVALVLLAVGGGVSGYFFAKGSNVAIARSYQKPDAITCKKVAENVIFTDDKVSMDLVFEMTLVQQPPTVVTVQSTLEALTDAVDDRFIPLIAGCPVSSMRRRLVSDDLRYAIADGVVGPAVQIDNNDNFLASVPVEVFLNGPEDASSVAELVQNIFTEESGEEALALPADLVSSVSLQDVEALADTPDAIPITPQPTMSSPPTDQPSSGPSFAMSGTPTSSPSSAPSNAPVFLQNSPPPTATPTAAPISRRDRLQALLTGPILSGALDWVSDVDTWEPDSGSSNSSQQWIERYAMVAFYLATNGDNWTTNSGWFDTTKSVCDGWAGVDTCDDGLVVELSFRSLGLTGTLPSEIGLLTELTYIRVSDDAVGGQIPSEIGNLSKLEDMSLSRSSLSGTIPTEIARMSSLTYLSLMTTTLSGSIPELPLSMAYFYVSDCELVGSLPSIGQLTNLVDFEVDGNGLTGTLPAGDLELLTTLEVLKVGRNDIIGSIPTTIWKMTELKDLSMHTLSLTGTIPTEIGLMTKLTAFKAHSNDLVGSIPTEVGLMTSLAEVEIEKNRLTSSIPTEIGRLTLLKDLDLLENELTGTIPTEIGNLSDLEELEIEENQLSGTFPTEIGLLTKLWYMTIDNTDISGSIPSEIGLATSLQRMDANTMALQGTIPSEIGNLTSLTRLRLYRNANLSGTIPSEIGLLTSLTELDIEECSLTGTIPLEVANLSILEIVFFADNALTGVVPSLSSTLTTCDINSNCFSDFSNAPGVCVVSPNCP